MATAQLIDLSNYDSLLVQSTQSRSGSPDGNIFFDVANGRIEIITAEELANVDLGSGAEAKLEMLLSSRCICGSKQLHLIFVTIEVRAGKRSR